MTPITQENLERARGIFNSMQTVWNNCSKWNRSSALENDDIAKIQQALQEKEDKTRKEVREKALEDAAQEAEKCKDHYRNDTNQGMWGKIGCGECAAAIRALKEDGGSA